MIPSALPLACGAGLALLVSACAGVPEALRAPADQVMTLELQARGVQVYECAAAKNGHEWTFKGPVAELFDAAGRPAGSHYGGPTWEAPDGSRVVGRLKARAEAPDAAAIPWLLLDAASTRGDGVFGRVRSIQRLQTAGGTAPAAPCGADEAARVERVPYTAVYRFYAAR